MGNLIEHDREEVEIVKVGGDGHAVSLKTYQDIYNQITGKTEETKSRYKDAIKISHEDIRQLHVKIQQLLDVHDVVACNQTINIFYEKERKDVFTSFEKFEAFNSSSASPVVHVVLSYNVSIVPAKLQRPQEYSITIRLSSRIALLKEIREDAPAFMQGPLAAMMTSETAEIKVDYVDYVIARGFIEVFDEWISGCDKTDEINVVKFAQKYSHFVSPLGKILIIFLYGFYIYNAIDSSFLGREDLPALAKFFIISGVAFYIVHMMSGVLLRILERSVDSYSYISWIKLNRGDSQLIRIEEKKIRNNIWMFLGSAFLTVMLGVLGSQISGVIDRFVG